MEAATISRWPARCQLLFSDIHGHASAVSRDTRSSAKVGVSVRPFTSDVLGANNDRFRVVKGNCPHAHDIRPLATRSGMSGT